MLHIYHQTLSGFKKLVEFEGPFKVGEDCIGINQDAVVKVYHSPDYAQIKPSSRVKTEEEMLMMIFSIIDQNTDFNTMPRQQQSIKNYICNGDNEITFDQALKKVEMYSQNYNGGVIPSNLDCVRRAGGG